MSAYLIGADPELFLRDKDGNSVSAEGLIGGTKHRPRLIRGDGCALQEDNVAVEFCIPACDSVERFIEVINFNLSFIEKEVADRGLFLDISASAEFSPEQLRSYQARTFGCDPDYNAWTLRINPKPKSVNKNFRSSGGHIHVNSVAHPYLVARTMDLFLGVPSVLMDPDTRRRELYGKAGACRPKEYGVEYRVLSNWWLTSDELKAWVFNQSQRAIAFAEEMDNWLEDSAEEIQRCINTSDKQLAGEIGERYGI